VSGTSTGVHRLQPGGAAVDEQFRAGGEGALVPGEVELGSGDVAGVADAAERGRRRGLGRRSGLIVLREGGP